VTQDYFLAMMLGVPLAILCLAMLAGYLNRDRDVLDWKPTRSPEREAELQHGDIHQMLEAQNRYRRQRGAPERTLEEVTEHVWAGLRSRRDAP
jgi:hypothetical protein